MGKRYAVATARNREPILEVLRRVLPAHGTVPEPRRGDVVVLDRLNAHKSVRVRELIEVAGARVGFFPAYSPDFNPIEHAWSKVKPLLQKREDVLCAT